MAKNKVGQVRQKRIALHVGLRAGAGLMEIATRICERIGQPPPADKGIARLVLTNFNLPPQVRSYDPSSYPGYQRPAPRRQLSSEEFYRSPEWRAVRYQALKLHGARCQCCGVTPAHGKVMHVDHIKPRSKFPHLELTLSNLQVLCEDCNMGKSNVDDTDWREPQADLGADVFLEILDRNKK